MRDLLRGRPIERVGHLDLRHGERRLTRGAHRGRLERDFEVQRGDRRARGPQVLGGLRILRGRQSLDERGRERVEGNEPWGDRGEERLPEERAERLVLEGLDVAGRPVVEEQHPEHVRVDVVDRHAFAAPARRADHDGEFELDVELHRSAPIRHRAGTGDVAARPHDLRPGHGDRAGPAVVADGYVAPVGEQRLAFRPEQAAEVRRVVDAGIHVDVVPDRDRQQHLQLASLDDDVGIRVARGVVGDERAHIAPRLRAEGEEVVEVRPAEHVGRNARRRHE